MRNLSLVTGLPFNVPAVQDITDTLLQRPNPNPPRTPEKIKRIAVHHSAVEGASIESYANYHVNSLGWPCIGYHVVIKDGMIFQTNDLLTFSYHTSNNNFDTVSVSVSGDLSKRPMSEPERNALYAVILTYMELFNVPVENVLGHNEYPQNNTSCPCIDMQKVRNDVRTLQNQMKYRQNDEHARAVARAIANQVLYLYNMMIGQNPDGSETDPGNVEWGKRMLLELEPFMRDRNLL